ncbi:hec ndc80p family protein [Diplodia corticola]|uniref:Probable kinetochore protein NDC80 n=1 Tax=Diplodia corticola TaxID=236234 RepID=A0A1J9RIH1_9PEZI|nr:hec ndc80p family protein [Diplodia corticola]OJD40448.1 hec ndc80p family protein [Diplodia corticola]
MANEQGLFSVRRPRETLGGLNTNLTGIPVPASAMKRSNSNSNMAGRGMGGRMSLAPGMGMGRPAQPNFHRSSSGNNLADMASSTSSAKRQSMAPNMFSSSRKSFAPGVMSTPAAAPAALDKGSQRRSSIWGARPSNGLSGAMGVHQSFFTTAPPAAAIPQDPRRLKDPSVRSQMAHELSEYLTRNNFEMDMKHSLTHKSFSSPTQKDFNCMFQWLYHRIDPSYRFQKNIDQEVPPLLKQMRYPFEKSIMKSQIAAVGGNNWSTFLGLLHWMMQLSQMIEHYASGAYDEASMEAGFDVAGDRIVFQFLTDAYRDWLQVDDDADEEEADQVISRHVQNMAAKFDDANAGHLEQVKVLEAEHQALQDQIDELSKNGPRIAKLDEQIKILEEDRIKFEEWNNKVETKVKKTESRAKLLDDEIKKVEAELEEAEQEKTNLQAMVDQQGITIQDIDRMNTERERLQKSAESTNVRLEETRRKIAEKELDATRKLDELERTVEKYNSQGYEIGIIPATAPRANGADFELVLTLSELPFNSSQMDTTSEKLLTSAGNGYQYHDLLNHDPRRELKNAILGLRKDIRDRMSAAQEADFENHEMLDKVKEAMDDKLSEVEALGHRVRAAEEEFEKTREITTAQKMGSDTQIERMEKELAKMRASLSESVQLMEQREMNTNIEYEQLQLRANDIREQLHTEIERILNDVIKWKIAIQGELSNFEDEVEKHQRETEQKSTTPVDADNDDVMEDVETSVKLPGATMTTSTTGSDDEEYVKGAIEVVKDTLLSPLRRAFSKPARRAYIQTALLLLGTLGLAGVAIASYSVFYFAYVPYRGFTVPVHLQYPSSSAITSPQQQNANANANARSFAELRDELCLGLSSSEKRDGRRRSEGDVAAYHPWGTAAGIRQWLVADQRYDVRVELDMPRTRANREAGNFMVELALLGPAGATATATAGSGIVGAYGEGGGGAGAGDGVGKKKEDVVLAVSRRPAILTWYSDVVENVNKAVEMPWYLLGWRREAERLVVGMMEGVRFERGWGNVPEALRVELRAVERLQVYAVRVMFEAKLQGLRYLMYNFRFTSALVFITLFWTVELVFMILAWLALSHVFSPTPAGSKVAKPDGQPDRPPTKPDEEETEYDLNKIKTEPEDETEETTDVPDLSDTPRTFPTYRGQQPLRYESPRVKSEDEDDEGTTESAVDIGGVAPEQEADDEDDEDADFVLDTAGRYMERDSGLGTSMESGQDRRREAIRKRRSGFFGGSGGGE